MATKRQRIVSSKVRGGDSKRDLMELYSRRCPREGAYCNKWPAFLIELPPLMERSVPVLPENFIFLLLRTIYLLSKMQILSGGAIEYAASRTDIGTL